MSIIGSAGSIFDAKNPDTNRTKKSVINNTIIVILVAWFCKLFWMAVKKTMKRVEMRT
jgi:hypothetical protein